MRAAAPVSCGRPSRPMQRAAVASLLVLVLGACDLLEVPDTGAPVRVVRTFPRGDGVFRGVAPGITFSDDVDAATVTYDRIEVTGLQPGTTLTLGWDEAQHAVTLNHDRLLPEDTVVRVVVRGGPGGIRSTSGGQLAGNTGADYVFSFRTRAGSLEVRGGLSRGAAWAESPTPADGGSPRYRVFSVTGDEGSVGTSSGTDLHDTGGLVHPAPR